MRRIDFFDGAESGTAPTLGELVASKLTPYTNDATYVAAEGIAQEGDVYANTTDNVVRYYNGSSWVTVATLPVAATDVTYNNATSGLTATDAQAAIDEVEGRVDTNEANITSAETNISNLETLSGSSGATDHGTFTGTTIADNSTTKVALQALETEVEQKVDSSDVGQANGVASLDSGGRLPSSQLPTSATEYKGAWNATTNTPTLVDGTGTNGDLYRVSVAGTQDLGSGSEDYGVGDAIIYNGTTFEKIPADDVVTSVNGNIGIVVLDPDDLDDTSTTNKFNQTHTGEVTGATSLTIDPTAITNKTEVTPESGDFFLFSDTSDTGALKKVDFDNLGGTGSGVGGVSLWGNPTFDKSINDVNTYDDTAATPTDGTGGSPTVITVSHETGSPLRGDGSLRVAKSAADGQGEGVSIDISGTLDDKYKTREIAFQYLASADYDTDDLQVYFYDVTNTTLIPVTGPNTEILAVGSNGATKTFRGRVQFTDSTSYRLIIHNTTTNALAWTVDIDQLRVGEVDSVPGVYATAWESYTPTFAGFGTVSSINIQWRRLGDTLQVRGDFTPGTTTAAEARMGLPSGLSGSVEISTIEPVGVWYRNVSSAVDQGIVLLETSTTYFTFGCDDTFADADQNAFTKQNGNAINTGQKIVIPITNVKIDNWDVGAQLSPSEVETILVRGEGNGGTTLTANVTPMDFTEVSDNLNAWDGSQFTAPRDGEYLFSGSLKLSGATSALFHIFVDGVKGPLVAYDNSTGTRKIISGQVSLLQGEVADIRATVGVTLSNSSTEHQLSIQEQPNFKTFSVIAEKHVATIKDVKSSGTNGGGSTGSTWNTRDLNTLDDSGIGATLASNQFTLPAGTYYISGFAPQWGSNAGQTRVRNITDGTTAIVGQSGRAEQISSPEPSTLQNVTFAGMVTIAAPKTFEVQHWVGTTRATDAFGVAVSSGEGEVYTTVTIEKLG